MKNSDRGSAGKDRITLYEYVSREFDALMWRESAPRPPAALIPIPARAPAERGAGTRAARRLRNR